jgi:hypothetical protein
MVRIGVLERKALLMNFILLETAIGFGRTSYFVMMAVSQSS